MKPSNKILLGFFGIIFLYLTAAFTEVRLRGASYFLNDENSIVETIDITGVDYLILSDLNHNISVIGSDTPRVEVRSPSGDLLQKLTYEVSRNTLNLNKLDIDEDQAIMITVYLPKNSLKGMTVRGANIEVEGLELEELTIHQTEGWIRFNGNNIINKLHVEASMAFMDVMNSQLDTLSILLEDSEVAVNLTVKQVEGSIKNGSVLRVQRMNEIQLKMDESSRIYNY